MVEIKRFEDNGIISYEVRVVADRVRFLMAAHDPIDGLMDRDFLPGNNQMAADGMPFFETGRTEQGILPIWFATKEDAERFAERLSAVTDETFANERAVFSDRQNHAEKALRALDDLQYRTKFFKGWGDDDFAKDSCRQLFEALCDEVNRLNWLDSGRSCPVFADDLKVAA